MAATGASSSFDPRLYDTQINRMIGEVSDRNPLNITKMAKAIIDSNRLTSLKFSDVSSLHIRIKECIASHSKKDEIVTQAASTLTRAMSALEDERNYQFNTLLEEAETRVRNRGGRDFEAEKGKVVVKIGMISEALKPRIKRCEMLFQSVTDLQKSIGFHRSLHSFSRKNILQLSKREVDKHIHAMKKAVTCDQKETVKFLFETAKILGIQAEVFARLGMGATPTEADLTSDATLAAIRRF